MVAEREFLPPYAQGNRYDYSDHCSARINSRLAQRDVLFDRGSDGVIADLV